jgi:CDP-diacylglycerol pyrophosphatase
MAMNAKGSRGHEQLHIHVSCIQNHRQTPDSNRRTVPRSDRDADALMEAVAAWFHPQ